MTTTASPETPSPLRSEGERNEAFRALAEPYRRELKLHCYRMLGSLSDAEDLVQETFLRAWTGLEGFTGRGEFRSWLYRIATNACLSALAKGSRARRLLPEWRGPPADRLPEGGPSTEIAWLEPYPDSELFGIADAAPGPEARYEAREAVKLAFIVAIQHLPPRQRAALLLCDVLGWSADEAARLVEGSVASVNSGLQRARSTLRTLFPDGRPVTHSFPDERQRALLDRYLAAWESADLTGFTALLRADAVFSMPPWSQWYSGRDAIKAFFGHAWKYYGGFRLSPTAANRQPAFAVYSRSKTGSDWRVHSIQLLELTENGIASLTSFRDAALFPAFHLEPVLGHRGQG